MQIFPEFQIPQAKISRIAESGFPQCSIGYRCTTVVQYMLIDQFDQFADEYIKADDVTTVRYLMN